MPRVRTPRLGPGMSTGILRDSRLVKIVRERKLKETFSAESGLVKT